MLRVFSRAMHVTRKKQIMIIIKRHVIISMVVLLYCSYYKVQLNIITMLGVLEDRNCLVIS